MKTVTSEQVNPKKNVSGLDRINKHNHLYNHICYIDIHTHINDIYIAYLYIHICIYTGFSLLGGMGEVPSNQPKIC